MISKNQLIMNLDNVRVNLVMDYDDMLEAEKEVLLNRILNLLNCYSTKWETKK
jgi:hypothetical protein